MFISTVACDVRRRCARQRISSNRRRGNFDSNSSTICCAVDAAIITQQRARERKRSAGSCAEQFNVATFGGNVALVRGRPRPPGRSSTSTPSSLSSLGPFILQKGQRNARKAILALHSLARLKWSLALARETNAWLGLARSTQQCLSLKATFDNGS